MLRYLGLCVLWLAVAGSGFFTLCSGFLALGGEATFAVMMLVGAAVTWGLVATARALWARGRARGASAPGDPDVGAQP